ncbi:uncharacterized protein LOC112042962 [Bicyclus anynana]|uniref:Uncharacterized protein LOC112042962 n=1 Tax=Bicyclus anynana TaxID=110368 RepID=A0A6J1MME4_BICAN|nr:uncharacterized protein LOC112042962 [Bicyclus anynana]
MMLKVIFFASAVSIVCGSQYAYFGDNLVEFDDPPAPTISLPYYPTSPRQESKVIKVESRPVTYDVGIRTAIVSSPPVMTKLDLILSPFRFVCSVATSIVSFIKRTITYIFTSIPALIFGCNLSAICKFFNIDPLSYVNEITSLVNPERLKRATDFVATAINKYKELQKEF